MNNQYDFYEIFNSEDVTVCCDKFAVFVKEIQSMYHREEALRDFRGQARGEYYGDAMLHALSDENFYYRVTEGVEAVRHMVSSIIDVMSTTITSDNDFHFLESALEGLKFFGMPSKSIIGKKFIDEFMTYIDKKYNMSSKIENIDINIIKNGHKNMQGYTMINPIEMNCQYIYLCGHQDMFKPEYVFFRELGNVIMNTYNIKMNATGVPSLFIKHIYKTKYYRNLDSIDVSAMEQMFADLISLGMVYNTPYPDYHHYSNLTSEQHQRELHELFCKMLDTL